MNLGKAFWVPNRTNVSDVSPCLLLSFLSSILTEFSIDAAVQIKARAMTASHRLSQRQDSIAARTRPTLEGKDKRIIDFFQLRTPNMMDHLERINDYYFYEILYPEKTTINEPKTCHLVCICIYEYINWITESVGDGRAPTIGCRTSWPHDLMCFVYDYHVASPILAIPLPLADCMLMKEEQGPSSCMTNQCVFLCPRKVMQPVLAIQSCNLYLNPV